jgi:hypothetical protein
LATEDRRLVRSIEILERAETADARQLLQALAKGHPDALATRQARSALDRLQNKLAP